MTSIFPVAGLRRGACITAIACVLPAVAGAQRGGPRSPRADSLREAARLDSDGSTAKAREIVQRLIESAPDPAAKAESQRALAMSYAFDGDCANTAKADDLVIAFWATREQAEPQNAFYQEGEMANEAARVCIDAGEFSTAERYYRRGTELGLKEPEPKTHPKSLWDFRLAHALARLAARRGNKGEAQKEVSAARAALDGDKTMAAQQERFYPYLTGYVALYTGDFRTAEADLTKAISLPGNANDPFFHCLLAMTYERLGEKDKSREYYQKAYDLATAHNPPAAFVRPFARKKLAR